MKLKLIMESWRSYVEGRMPGMPAADGDWDDCAHPKSGFDYVHPAEEAGWRAGCARWRNEEPDEKYRRSYWAPEHEDLWQKGFDEAYEKFSNITKCKGDPGMDGSC